MALPRCRPRPSSPLPKKAIVHDHLHVHLHVSELSMLNVTHIWPIPMVSNNIPCDISEHGPPHNSPTSTGGLSLISSNALCKSWSRREAFCAAGGVVCVCECVYVWWVGGEQESSYNLVLDKSSSINIKLVMRSCLHVAAS